MTIRGVCRRFGLLAAIGGAIALGACSTSGPMMSTAPEPAAVPNVPPGVAPTEIVGRWGYAAYHKADDRPRTEAAARSQCRQPFIIGAGPTGGVMMYPADSNKLEELSVKGAPGGKTFIGPAGPPGSTGDREIMSFDGRVMTMRFVDPEVAGRYGTGIYVRCGPRA